jgi:glycosyltransferase involved in cell wall biosynthesis
VSTPRLLFVSHSAALGGAELYLLDVVRERPHAEVVLFEDGPLRARLEAAAVPVTVLPAAPALLDVRKQAGLWSLLQTLPALIGLVLRLARRARTADLLYLNSQKAMIVGALAGWGAGTPVVWNLHDLLTADHFSAGTRRAAVFVANRLVDRVVVNSEATRAAFRESGGTVPTSLVYNGIHEPPAPANGDADRAALRRALGLPDAPLVGVFSRLSAWKGQHVLIDALVTLPDVHALLVGDALFGDDRRYAAGLRRQCEALGLRDRVHFLGFRDDVPALMRLVDVVLHTSTAPEPFGRVVVEGMLARRPVVATRQGGVLEIVEDGVTGRLVPPGDAPALAHTLRTLLASPDAAARLAANGYTRARSAFSVSSMLDGLQDAVDATLADNWRTTRRS